MAAPITPTTDYAYRHKETGALALVLYLGTGDSLGNYEEITEEEYKRTLAEQEERAAIE